MDHRTATVPPRAPARARAARGDTAMRSAAISEGETALKIPFGNKEAALTLGARYRSGGWFAPPGTDLAPLREKGWVRDETGPPPHG